MPPLAADSRVRDTQSRKWLLTVNNPMEHGYSHDYIKAMLITMRAFKYGCMSDERGAEEDTHHTHAFFSTSSGVRFSTVKRAFPHAHIDVARGTCEQNRDYVAKTGKWSDDVKHGTSIEGTFEEVGEMPVEHQGQRADMVQLYEWIRDGKSNAEILALNPDHLMHLDKMDKARQTFREDAFKSDFRILETTYIWGATGTGKTRGVMEKYGYENVFRVTNYCRGSFDMYKGQDVVIFEEFRSGFTIGDMLNYLDGYPVMLSARYGDKVACFTKVYLINNTDLFEQYHLIQMKDYGTWEAFLRRINTVKRYHHDGTVDTYTLDEYVSTRWTRQPVEGELEDTPPPPTDDDLPPHIVGKQLPLGKEVIA